MIPITSLILITGYVYDLAKALKDLVKGFEYKLVPVTDKEYGRYFKENNTWTGMVGELVYRVSLFFSFYIMTIKYYFSILLHN